MFTKKQNILKYIVNEKINFILNLFLFLIFLLFFLKSFNYSFYWYEAFKAALKGNADHIFWDFEVYKCSAEFFINNQNPYNLITECSPSKKPFIHNYPPLTTLFFIPFTLINFFWAKIIWGILLIFFLLIFINFQRKLFQTKIHYLLYFVIILYSLDKTIIYSFFTGNNSFILQILIGISFYFLSKNNKNIFFIIVCLVSFFKFYFLIFILCPILLYKLKYIKEIIFSILLVGLFYLFNYLFDPILFANWLSNVYKASIAKGYYEGFGIGSLNYIISLFDILENNKIIILNKREYYEVAFTFLYLISIVSIGYFFLTKNKINKSKSQNLKLALSILLIGICIPRLEIYELIIFVAPIIFLLENYYNYRQDKNIYKIILNFIFISLFLLNGDSGITYPFLVFFMFSTLFFYKKNSKFAL